jgi:HAD superfamily hydrolase (TIGR01450 family)
VLLGDLGERWSYALLQEAFEHLRAGAELITCSRDRMFRRGQRLVLDVGPFVAALEYASGATALLAGKPSAAIFSAALRQLAIDPADRGRVIMIGDDLHSDIAGAQAAGLEAWAVQTGKFSAADAARLHIAPDRIIPDLRVLLADLDA